jgi:transposase
MEVTYTHCAGLDVHKKTVVACCLTPGEEGEIVREVRTFSTMTGELLKMGDWLSDKQVTHVAMESTGEYWKPVYNLLEDRFTLLVVNAQHIKKVPGRKTDVKDAEWIADLLRHGLLRGSFIPPLAQRDLRDLTRQRTKLVQERASVVNRLQKVLEWANLKLAAVVTDVTRVSARKMLEALCQGTEDVNQLADLAKGRLRMKRTQLEESLAGYLRPHHRFLITSHLTHLDFLEEQIATFDAQIEQLLLSPGSTPSKPPTPSTASPVCDNQSSSTESDRLPALSWEAAVALLDTIPGVGRQTAEMLLAEIGSDMTRFHSDAHLAKWAQLCPGNHESGGKRYSGRTGHGNTWLRSGLIQAAHAAVRCKNTFFQAVYRRLAQRRGKKKAIVAVAHKILKAAYHVLCQQQPYRDLGANYLDERHSDKLLNRLRRRIEQLGYQVSLESITQSEL